MSFLHLSFFHLFLGPRQVRARTRRSRSWRRRMARRVAGGRGCSTASAGGNFPGRARLLGGRSCPARNPGDDPVDLSEARHLLSPVARPEAWVRARAELPRKSKLRRNTPPAILPRLLGLPDRPLHSGTELPGRPIPPALQGAATKLQGCCPRQAPKGRNL